MKEAGRPSGSVTPTRTRKVVTPVGKEAGGLEGDDVAPADVRVPGNGPVEAGAVVLGLKSRVVLINGRCGPSTLKGAAGL
jgi:hypothetical protein